MSSATVAFATSAESSTRSASASALVPRSWVPLSPPASPGARSGAAMAFDPAINKMVLFGGYGGKYPNFRLFSDTWTYDGTTWTQESPATAHRRNVGRWCTTRCLGRSCCSAEPRSAGHLDV